MSVYQRVMSDGEWDLQLRYDTPRSVLDQITSFTSHVVITPAPMGPITDDAGTLAAARYVGVVRRPGPNRRIGGRGLAMWLSDSDGKGEVFESKLTFASATLATCVSTTLPSSLISGTVTSPGGTLSATYQWVTARDVLNSVCRAFGVEWKIRNTVSAMNFQVDVATVANLYGSTPTAMITRRSGGREPVMVGVASDIDVSIDHEDYVSKVVVIGAGGRGSSGGASTFRKPHGPLVTWTRVVESPDTPLGSENAAAAQLAAQMQTSTAGRREVQVSTDVYDVAGDLVLGADLWVWDPDYGLIDTTNQVTYRGELVFPTKMRLIGMRWPVRSGMGVYIRSQTASFTPTWVDITPYVEFEDGAAGLELGAASVLVDTDAVGSIVQARGLVEAGAWQPYVPTLGGFGFTLGNGVVTASYRREGTTLHLRVRFTLGTTSVIGAGGITVPLPSGMVAAGTGDDYQTLGLMINDTGTADFEGRVYIAAGSATLICQALQVVVPYDPTLGAPQTSTTYVKWVGLTATVPHTWASTDFINLNGTIEVQP